MNTIQQLQQEFKQEYETTKKFLERFPEGKTTMHLMKKA